jgi:hypothetical protein
MVVQSFSQYPSYGVAPGVALLDAGRRPSLGRTVMAIAVGALAFDLALIRPCNETIVPAVTLAAATMVEAGGGWLSQAHAAAPAVGVWDPGESLLAPEPMGVVQQFVTGSTGAAPPRDTTSASPPDAPSAPEEAMLREPVLISPSLSPPAERAAAPRAVPAPPAVTRPRAATVRREASLAAGRPAHRVAPRKPLDLAAVAAAPARTRTVASAPAAEAALGFRAPPARCVPPFVFALGSDAWEICGGRTYDSRAAGGRL